MKYLIVMSLALAACGRGFQAPEIDETGFESATEVVVDSNNPDRKPADLSIESAKLSLNQAMSLRFERAGILELKAELPAGAVITVPSSYEVKHLDYRNSSGTVERSSTGFVTPVTLVSVPKSFQSQFPAAKIASINATAGGLYLSASIVGAIEGIGGNFAVLGGTSASAEFLKNYEASGRPKFDFTRGITKRFGAKLNRAASLNSKERAKYERIYAELKRGGDRTVATPKALLMIEKTQAVKAVDKFEKLGQSPMNGAWTMAVEVTAPRHGFGNVPCAEFQSEMIRQAYQRAGYDADEDFNAKSENRLLWSESAAVVNLADHLARAGWVPWNSRVYRPMTGAILMHGTGNSPGHTYMSGGDDGRIVVDNGAPQGRDLRKTKQKTTSLMFQTGVFFLPPGINPSAW